MSTDNKEPTHFSNNLQSDGSPCHDDDDIKEEDEGVDNYDCGGNVDDDDDAVDAQTIATQSNTLASSTAITSTQYNSLTSTDCFAVALRLHPRSLQAHVGQHGNSFDFPEQVC
jgi:broad-specificity NMP kinase